MSKISQRKQAIRLWFEFYKLALDDPMYKNEIKKSREFYESWGDIRSVKFDDWFKEKNHLFSDPYDVEILQTSTQPDNPELIYITAPRNWSATRIIKELRPKLESAIGLPSESKKHKTISKSQYRITSGKELKTTNINYALILYRDVYLKLGKPPKNEKLLSEVHKFYRSRKIKKDIPSPFGSDTGINIGLDSNLRTMRRYIQKAELLIKNASLGDFPGSDY
jgi:hypothetical protein